MQSKVQVFYLFILFLSLGLWNCSSFTTQKEEGLPIELHVLNNDSQYVGIPLKLWVDFETPVTNYDDISWALGEGELLGKRQTGLVESIKSDTILVEWNRLPMPVSSLNTEGLSGYVDTISVVVNGLRSKRIPIQITNVFPRIDSIVLDNGFTNKIIDDSVYITARQGAPVVLDVNTTDLLNPLPVNIIWPDFMWKEGINPKPNDGDGKYYFDNAPIKIFDKSGFMRVQDGAGAERVLTLRYQTYKPNGSFWAASEVELMHLAGEGFEIYRGDFDLGGAPLIKLSKNTSSLYISREPKKLIEKYSFLNFSKDKNFHFTSIAKIQKFELGSNYFWVTTQDNINTNVSSLSKYSLNDGSFMNVRILNIPGSVIDFAVEYNSPGNIWYIHTESDSIHYAENDSIYNSFYNGLENPQLLSYDNESEILWVSSNEALYIYSKKGSLIGKMEGFQNITSISSGLGFCWVADGFSEKVYLISSDVADDRTLDDLTSTEFFHEVSDPVDVVMIRGTVPQVLVAEYGNSSVVKIDDKGEEKFRITGVNLPRKIIINQEY